MNGSAGIDHVQEDVQEDTALGNDPGKDVTSSTYYGAMVWDGYRSFVRQNRTSLELLDAGLSRILFWTPNGDHNNNNDNNAGGNRHREVLYGILSLHRLAMDTALQQQQDMAAMDDYGTTVRPNPADDNHGGFFVSPTALRMALTVLQSLLPSILELSSSQSSSSHENENNHHSHQRQQRARARLQIERVKFALRLTLLGTYWKRLLSDQNQEREKLAAAAARQRGAEHQPRQPSVTPPLSLGLLTDGGLFHGLRPTDNVPTLQQEQWEWEKRSYVGRRTGRKVTRRTMQGGDSLYSSAQQQQQQQQPPMPWTQRISAALPNNHHLPALSVVLGELLYAYRPLYWAATEATGQASYRSWVLSLVMDVVSLQLCRRNPSTPNAATQAEWNRRQMRLLLYLLRAPVWDKVTGPSAERVGDLFDKVPLLGRLVSTYLRDWLCYMKHPYVSEEG